MENKQLNRRQKRYQERVSAEAKQAYEQLTKQFLDFFIFSDSPTEEKIVAKMEEISKKWRLYCQRKQLLPNAYPIIDQYMDGVIKQYSEMDKKKDEGFGIVEPIKVDDGLPS